MAKSKARKQREKQLREGRLNPEIHRGSWGEINPVTKQTPTLIEKQRKLNSKHKKRFTQGDQALDKSFLIFCKGKIRIGRNLLRGVLINLLP